MPRASADPGSPLRVVSPRGSPPVRVRLIRAEALGHGQRTEPPVCEELFRDALVRERKRADRFEEPFALMLVSLSARAMRQLRWRQVVEALSDAKLDTDVIGWFEQGAVLGLLRSFANHEPNETAARLADTVRHELLRCLTPGG